MNRKPLTLTTLTILTLTIFTSACTTIEPTNEILPMVSDLQTIVQAAQAYLPAGMVVTGDLPTTITDPQLMAAWIYLHNQVETIIVWDASAWSGQALAEFLRDNHVPLNWSTPEVCQYSCTVRPVCENDDCARAEEKDYPIYLDPELKNTNIEKIAGTLAHETYHHTEPFGKVRDSLFEEYWAFKIGSAISGESWGPLFVGDEYKPYCLNQWFSGKSFITEYSMPEYPQEISTEMLLSETVCHYQPIVNQDAVVSNP